MTSREWAIAVVYTLATAIEALCIGAMITASDADIGFIWFLISATLGTWILGSLFSYDSEADDVQEY